MKYGREEALTQLLGLDSHGSEYPPSFTIPQTIHEQALSALSETVQDGHERSLHFRYRQNQWRGGVAVKGTQTSVSFLHTNSTLFWPPHIHIHTHPDVFDDELRAAVEESSISGLNSVSEVEDVVTQALQLFHQAPSSRDVFRALNEPSGSVGHILFSSYGSFAWIHRDVRATKGIFENTFLSARYRRKTDFAKNKEAYVEERDVETFGDITNMELVRQQLLHTRASALESAYVCYANDEPQKPSVEKIEA